MQGLLDLEWAVKEVECLSGNCGGVAVSSDHGGVGEIKGGKHVHSVDNFHAVPNYGKVDAALVEGDFDLEAFHLFGDVDAS